ncbi:SIR2 family protein [Pedobacter sp. MC2016-14]|uniref:SIR2 family NAD-dependent protein deacylase n=1 Tax=Pedobacter sp. MC2016-14 TaxID=2897327 RepID=UPI001E6583D4|nr:SIR2 family protein [Pedobacter sp. MC2016-14]MCD0490594.1 SIR2 family protein [Pedobacter sp. MC2016-14]
MSDYLDIATSLHTNSLTLFVGTGFSKYITNGKAPSWLELLVDCARAIDKNDKLLNQLFNSNSSGEIKEAIYDLTICAQILESEFLRKRRSIKEEISNIIRKNINEKTIDKDKLSHLQSFFQEHPNINIVTTNYDTIFSDYIIPITSRIVIEGSIIPRINSGQNIYHIHGCVNKPESIILTINDYYNFQNSNNYFSRKFFTLLQETTVAILGYSLGDFNLNSILNEVKNSKNESFRRTEIYYVTKDSISDVIEKFYSMTYGIKVIQNTDTHTFFDLIERKYDKAKGLIDSVEDLKDVIAGTHYYTDEFLKLKLSLTNILLQASSLGIDSRDMSFLKTLIFLLKKKRQFTRENNAWTQYEHLADWLIEIASIITIKGSEFEKDFCEIAKYSLSNASKEWYKGYSWHAWQAWRSRWHEMKLENQIMVEDIIETNSWPSCSEIPAILD